MSIKANILYYAIVSINQSNNDTPSHQVAMPNLKQLRDVTNFSIDVLANDLNTVKEHWAYTVWPGIQFCKYLLYNKVYWESDELQIHNKQV